MDRRKILITGGAGYIGYNLEKYLSAEWFKYDVTICDFGYTDVPLAEQLESEDVQQFDGIVHLAALSGIIPCQENPKRAIRRNLLTAYNVFREASKFKIPVVFTSSGAAKKFESSTYAMQKRMIELMAEQFNDQGANITVFRLSNVYGGELYIEKKSTVIKQFVKSYGEGKPLSIHGDGSQERDFINVEDVCVLIERALKTPYTVAPVDIGTGVGTSIETIAKYFQQHTPGYPVEFLQGDRTVGVESSIADPTMSEHLWRWKASPRMYEYIAQQIYLQKEKS